MRNNYRCDSCGCYLDPGEGILCDECRADMKHRTEKRKRMEGHIFLNDGQYTFDFEGGHIER